MMYNFIIIENKIQTEYLNIETEKEFFEKLWEWTYEDDLWDFIEENEPDYEYLIHFIDENIFHQYYEDEIDCFAFIVNDNGKINVYNWNVSLEKFVLNKIKEKYGKVL